MTYYQGKFQLDYKVKLDEMHIILFMTSFLLTSGSVSGQQEISRLPSNAFNQSLAVLARLNGLPISYDFTIVALISQITNMSSSRVGNIMQGLGASSKLVTYLNTTTVSQTIEQFYGINQVYKNFTVSAYDMTIMLIKLDSTQTTQAKLQLLRTQVPTSEFAVARFANVSREELLKANFLTEFNPRFSSIADQVTMTTTRVLITDLGLTEQRFEAITKVNVTYLNHLRASKFVALVSENAALAENLTRMINGIVMQPLATLQRSLALNMSMVRTSCAGLMSDFENAKFSFIFFKCLGFKFSSFFVAAALNIKDKKRIEFYDRASPADMMHIIKLSSPMFDATQVAQVISLVENSINELTLALNVPISLQSYRSGIAFANLPNYPLIHWVETVSQISVSILLKVFIVPLETLNALNGSRFVDIPEAFKAKLGAIYPVNHFLTFSFGGLISLLAEKTPVLFARQEISRGIVYLLRSLQLWETQAVYGSNCADLLQLSLIRLSQGYAGVSPDQLQVILQLSKQQMLILDQVSIEDAAIIFNQTATILNMTLLSIGNEIAIPRSETRVLYDSATGVLRKAGKSELNRTSTVSDIIVTYGQVDQIDYERLLAGLGGSTAFSAMIAKYSQVSFAAAVNLNVDAVTKTPLLTFLKTLKTKSDQESNVCLLITHDCNDKSHCVSHSSGSYTCNCLDWYEKKDGKCVEKSKLAVILVPVLAMTLLFAFATVAFFVGYVKYRKGHARSSDLKISLSRGITMT